MAPDGGLKRTLSPRLRSGGSLRSSVWQLWSRFSAEAVAFSVITTISAMFAYRFLEGIGIPALRSQTVAFVLVSSFCVGVALFSRRYA